MTVYVLKPDTSEFSINRQAAIVGFTARGHIVKIFEQEDLLSLEIDKGDIVVAGIGNVHRIFKKAGLDVLPVATIPASLKPFTQRSFWMLRLGEVHSRVEKGEQLFIKPPPEQTKIFSGHPVTGFADLIKTAHIPDDTLVECSDFTPFLSEFRAFLMHGELVGFRQYKGDPLVFPDPVIVNDALAAFKPEAPAGCVVDFGVTGDNKTAIVEVNDGYATGAYGLGPLTYAGVIEARWNEIWKTCFQDPA